MHGGLQEIDPLALPAKGQDKVRLSVVIPVYEDSDRLAGCLHALASQDVGTSSFEVLVVDNGSRKAPAEIVSQFRFARLLHEAKPGSYNARNTGCDAAVGDFLAFTDSDCRPAPNWLSSALRYFGAHPEVAAIGGRIELETGHPPNAAEIFETVFAFHQQRYVNRSGFAATANMMVKRAVYEAVGPFDGRLKSGGDREWGQRMARCGHLMNYADDVVVTHPARRSLRELARKRRRVLGIGSFPDVTIAELRPDMDPRPYSVVLRGKARVRAMLFRPHDLGLSSHAQGLKLLLVVLFLDTVGFWERLRLRLGGSPLR